MTVPSKAAIANFVALVAAVAIIVGAPIGVDDQAAITGGLFAMANLGARIWGIFRA